MSKKGVFEKLDALEEASDDVFGVMQLASALAHAMADTEQGAAVSVLAGSLADISSRLEEAVQEIRQPEDEAIGRLPTAKKQAAQKAKEGAKS